MIAQTASGLTSIEDSEHCVLQMPISGFTNFPDALQSARNVLRQKKRDAVANICKICMLTDGKKIHVHKKTTDKDEIDQRYLVHVGDKHLSRSKELADDINFLFGHFIETTIDAFAEHFMLYF